MANTVIHVYYRVSDGKICASQYGTEGAPVTYPDSNGHDTTLEIPLMNDLPTGETHKVDTAPTPHVVVPQTQPEIDAARDAERKALTELTIGRLTTQRDAMAAHTPPFDTTEIDQQIVDCEAEWAALP